MADAIEIKKSVSPLLEEVNRYHQYDSENKAIDDGDIDYSVTFQKGEDPPVALSKPSLALFHGDPSLYEQEFKRLRQQRLDDTLRVDLFPRNQGNFHDLKKIQQVNRITPFVGAGSSISAGCSSWPSYLKSKALELGLSEIDIQPLLDSYRYEELLDLVVNQPRGREFEFYFQQDFEHANPESSFSWRLPDIFNGCVITTNFDRVVEECFSEQASAFTEKVDGLNSPHNFLKAITRGERYLLKLHGNIDNPRYRVFTREEYKRAYSQDDSVSVDMSFPLPKILAQLYRSHSFLFLGCSLNSDRTVSTFRSLVDDEGPEVVADHFAIIEAMEDEDQQQALEEQLVACNIKPIWYENGEHHKVDEILSLLQI